jgi:hypothetical protein
MKRTILAAAALIVAAFAYPALAQSPFGGPSASSTPSGAIAPNNTTGVLLKAAPGTISSIQLGGIGSAPAYLKLYDSATAPTCGSGTPVKRLIIPAALRPRMAAART